MTDRKPPSGLRVPLADARLTLAMNMAEECRVSADIGADHGRLSAALLSSGRAKHVLVTDVSEKSLLKAKRLLGSHGLEDRATFAVADGLFALDALEGAAADTVFILGMGGETLGRILLEGSSRLRGAELILGAQTELPSLRRAICAVGYRIRKEEIAREGGRSYILTHCTPAGKDEPEYGEEELLLGPALLRQLPPEWKPMLERRRAVLAQANAQMEQAPRDKDSTRLRLSRRELDYVEATLKRYQRKENRPVKAVTVQMILDWLDALAPFDSAESFDNVGLLMGDPAAPVTAVVFGLDATPELIGRASVSGAELMITHHPLIFNPLRRIDYTCPQGQALTALAAGRLNLIAAHTNWDKAAGGVSDALGQALGLTGLERCDDYLRLGSLPSPMTADQLQGMIANQLQISPRRYGFSVAPIRRVAVAGGAYGEAAAQAFLRGAEAYVVGEIKHHELMDACARGLVVYEAGHYATEAPGIAALYRRFMADAAAAGWQVRADLFDNAPYPGATLGKR